MKLLTKTSSFIKFISVYHYKNGNKSEKEKTPLKNGI